MTEERMALIELIEKQADGDLGQEMLAFAAERIMEAAVEARTGPAMLRPAFPRFFRAAANDRIKFGDQLDT